MRLSFVLMLAASTFMFLGLAGCGPAEEKSTPPATETDADSGSHGHEHGDHDHEHGDHDHGPGEGHHDHDDEKAAPSAEEGADAAEIEQALARLSPEDRALAEKQRVCPVSQEPLGSMGTPIKVNVDGKDVLICCKGCEKAL